MAATMLMEDPLSKRLRSFHSDEVHGEVAGVYITTNEVVPESVISHLARKTLVPNCCHIGFSGWHNFDIMALRHSAYGLLCDFNPHEREFLLFTLRTLKESSSKESFARKMIAYARTCHYAISYNFDFADPIKEIAAELSREGSWLSSDESFHYIQELAMKDKIAVITDDVRDSETFKKIGSILQFNGIAVDTIYLSNICHYMYHDGDQEAFVSTVNHIMESETSVINCPLKHRIYTRIGSDEELDLGSNEEDALVQHVMMGKELRDSPQSFFNIKVPYTGS